MFGKAGAVTTLQGWVFFAYNGSGGATFNTSIDGNNDTGSDEDRSQRVFPAAGRVRELVVRQQISFGQPVTWVIRKNGADTALSITFAASETGIKKVVIDVEFAKDDLVNLQVRSSASLSPRMGISSAQIEIGGGAAGGNLSNSGIKQPAGVTEGSNGKNGYYFGTEIDMPVGGGTMFGTIQSRINQSTEQITQIAMPKAGKITNLLVRSIRNSSNNQTEIFIRKNGANVGTTIIIGAGVDTIAEVIQNISFVQDDLINFRVVFSGTTGDVRILPQLQVEIDE